VDERRLRPLTYFASVRCGAHDPAAGPTRCSLVGHRLCSPLARALASKRAHPAGRRQAHPL